MAFDHELILPNEDLPFRLFAFEGKDGNYIRDKHWHRSVEIFAVCDGEITFYIDDKRYTLQAGEFMLVNSNEVHAVHAPRPNKTIVLQIPLAMFGSYCTEENYIFFTHDPGKRDKKLMEMIQEMYEVYIKKERGYDMKVKGIFYLLLHLLVSEYQKTDITGEQLRRNKNLNKLSAITSYIKENYTSDLSLESVADHFDYTPTYLSKMFRIYAGISFKAYIQDVRLRNAIKDIQRGEDSLSSIAMKYGFSGSRAMARSFQKKYGMLPSEYKKKNLK